MLWTLIKRAKIFLSLFILLLIRGNKWIGDFAYFFFLKSSAVQVLLPDLSFFFLKFFIAQWKRLVYVAVLCYLCMFLYRFGWLWLVLVVACFVTNAIYSRWVEPWCIMLVSCSMCIIYIYIYVYMPLSFFISTSVDFGGMMID